MCAANKKILLGRKIKNTATALYRYILLSRILSKSKKYCLCGSVALIYWLSWFHKLSIDGGFNL